MRLKSSLFSTLALAAGLLTMYSCTLDPEQLPQRGPVSEDADFLVVTENPVTKTVFDGEHTLWAENDKITAIDIEDGGNEYFASSMSYRGDNRFGGRVTYAGDVNNWYLIYPYRADNVTPEETHILIPEVQVQDGNDDMSHIAGDGFPLIGKELGVSRSNQLHVTMRNVLARLDFKVTNSAGSPMVFKQVVFTASAEICGEFVGDITNDSPAWTAQTGAFKDLTLTIENGEPVANGEMAQFHAGIAPLTVPANGSMKAKVVAVSPDDPENEIVFYHVFNVPNGTTLKSGVSYGFNMSFDTEHGVDPSPGGPVSSGNVYVKASSLTVGGTYLIVDHQDQRLFKGSTDGSYVSVSPVNGVITDTNNSLSAYEFTVTQSGNVYCLVFNDNRYLVCDYSSNSSTGIRYESSKPAERYLYSLTINGNGGFEFSTDQMNSTSTNEILYFKSSSDYFKIGGSGAGIGVHLYLKDASSTPGKQPQYLSFSQSEVTETRAEATGTLAVQPVSGAQTDVDYTSSNTNVATVSGTTLYIHGFGTTIITANARESEVYSSASVSYNLTVSQEGSATGPRTYTYVAPGSLEPGTYVIAGAETGELSVALFPSVGTASWNSQTTGQVNNGQYVPHKVIGNNNSVSSFTTEDADIIGSEVVLAKSGNNWTIQVKSTGQYLVVPSQEYRISFVGSSSATAFEISNGTNGATVRSGSYYFYHSGSAGGFTFRTNSTSNIRFYLSSGGSTSGKQPQNLSFSRPSVTETRAEASGTLAVQPVSGARTDVDYTSSNTNVATVSGTTLYIHGFGTTIITANARESDVYSSASAQYELTVAQGGSTTPTGSRTYTYVAPGSLEPGTYLIAGSETGELSVALFPSVGTASWNSQTTGQVNNGQYVPHKVIGTSNSVSSFTTEDVDIIGSEVVLAKSGNNWTIQVKSTGQYLVVPSQEYRISFLGSSSATAFEISNGTNGATVRSGNYYFYHSGSAGGFTFRTNSTSNIRFYQAPSDGTTPTTGKKDQNLTFSNPTVNWTLGSGYSVGNNYSVQTPNNYYGYLTYTSGDTNVATVSGNRISIVGPGNTRITVTASGNDDYNPGTASYMLYILPESGMMVYNLENDCVSSYLDAAMAYLTASDRSSSLIKNTSWNNSAVYDNFIPSSSTRYDCPKPVPISWSSVVTGEKTVYIYNNSTCTDEELHVTSTGTSADVYNLIPGRIYYYRVMSGSQRLAEGSFMTSGRRRMIKVSDNYSQNHANNCRDLGGQITTSGKTIKYGKIIRGSNMDETYKTTNASGEKTEQSVILNYLKVRLDVDLRAKTRNYATNSLDCGNNGNNMCNALQLSDIPVQDVNTYIGHTQEEYDNTSHLRDPERMRYTLMRIFNAVHNNVNVYIHCMVGADRTGFTCMMLEALLGVPLERCDMDFEMTSFSVVGTRPRTIRNISHYNDGVDAINGRLTSNPNATFQDKAIDYAVNVLGVNRSVITQFQNDMLE